MCGNNKKIIMMSQKHAFISEIQYKNLFTRSRTILTKFQMRNKILLEYRVTLWGGGCVVVAEVVEISV